MKEFINKLIERLEEEKQSSPCRNTRCKDCKYTNQCYEGEQCYKVGIDNIKEIINQLAEEHKDDIQTIDVSELLGESVNDGWIACSERFPEEDVLEDGYVEPSEAVLVLTKYNSYKVSRYWGNRRNKRDYHDWVDIEYRKNEVIAWKPIAPYQPKGE